MAWVKLTVKDNNSPVFFKSSNICAVYVGESGSTAVESFAVSLDIVESIDEVMHRIAEAEKHKIEGVK